MKIAINCIYYSKKGGGIAEYIKNLVRELALINTEHELLIYITKEYQKDLARLVGNKVKIKLFPYNSKNKIYRALFQQAFWKQEEKKEKFDIFHSPFFHAPKFNTAKTILTVHDLRFLRYPTSYTKKRYIYLKSNVKASIRRADYIIAISEFTKGEIIDNYGYDANKIQVVYEAVDFNGFKLKNMQSECTIKGNTINANEFILSVGHLEPRKNYENLIKAYNQLASDIKRKFKLIIVGKKNHDYKQVIHLIEQNPDVIYLDFVSRDELVWLYANCEIHAFPSYYEGFGFPSLEAGIYSKPTVGANCSSIPEITGEGGIYFDPFSIDDISSTLNRVILDEELKTKLALNSRKNVNRYSWNQNAIETLKSYNYLQNV